MHSTSSSCGGTGRGVLPNEACQPRRYSKVAARLEIRESIGRSAVRLVYRSRKGRDRSVRRCHTRTHAPSYVEEAPTYTVHTEAAPCESPRSPHNTDISVGCPGITSSVFSGSHGPVQGIRVAPVETVKRLAG